MTGALAVLALLSWAAATATSSSRSAYQSSSMQQLAETKARRAVDRIVAELAAAFDPVPIVPLAPGPEDGLEFTQAEGVVAGAIDPSPPVRIVSELDPAETHDGDDDDQDGLIDERRVVLVRNAGLMNERRIVLCRNVASLLEGETEDGDDNNLNGLVDEAGLSIALAGDLLSIRLSVQERGRDDALATATVETTVRLRMED
jgi:hypothetical protein